MGKIPAERRPTTSGILSGPKLRRTLLYSFRKQSDFSSYHMRVTTITKGVATIREEVSTSRTLIIIERRIFSGIKAYSKRKSLKEIGSVPLVASHKRSAALSFPCNPVSTIYPKLPILYSCAARIGEVWCPNLNL